MTYSKLQEGCFTSIHKSFSPLIPVETFLWDSNQHTISCQPAWPVLGHRYIHTLHTCSHTGMNICQVFPSIRLCLNNSQKRNLFDTYKLYNISNLLRLKISYLYNIPVTRTCVWIEMITGWSITLNIYWLLMYSLILFIYIQSCILLKTSLHTYTVI